MSSVVLKQLQSASLPRGNQRELARAKNAKKGGDKGKKADDGLSAAARKQRDAEIMQEKQKAEKKGAGGGKEETKSK
ncbi:Small EDRK-rich factor 2 [Dissostichus eleginoides]|nr:Small EDRK-rich factor 2 [Dissostichus eleginoides]